MEQYWRALAVMAVFGDSRGGGLMVEPRTGRSEGIVPDDGTSSTAPSNWAARHD